MCSTVSTTSTAGFFSDGTMPTGMPRPLSITRTPPSARIVTSIVSACPASASSTELSTTSYTRWWRPRSPVEPMYMPGRLRTASRPSRTVIALASYEDATSPEAVAPPLSPGVDGMFSLGLPESATKRPFWHSTSRSPDSRERLRRSACNRRLPQGCGIVHQSTGSTDMNGGLPVPEYACAALNERLTTPHIQDGPPRGSRGH